MLSVGFDIGLDSVAVAAATCAGILFVQTVPRSYTIKENGTTIRAFDSMYHDRLYRIAHYAKGHRPRRVLVEQSFGALNLRTFKSLSHAEAEIRYELAREGVAVEFLAPTRWQSKMLGTSMKRAQLERVSLREAHKRYREKITVHEADAINIAYFGLIYEGDICPVPKRRRRR